MSDSNINMKDLVARAHAEDRDALGELCEELQPQLLAYARSFMNDRASRLIEPEDLVQKVLEDLIANPQKFLDPDDPEKLKKFLFGRVSWRFKDVLREGSRLHGESEVGNFEAAQDFRPVTGPVTGGDDRRWLRVLIEHLHGRTRDVVILCGLEGHSYESAAMVLGISADAVRKAYGRASEALKAAATKKLQIGDSQPNSDASD